MRRSRPRRRAERRPRLADAGLADKTIWPAPARPRGRSRNRALSAARPTRSVSGGAASNRLSAAATPSTTKASMGSAKPSPSGVEVAQPEQVTDEAAGGAGDDDLPGSAEPQARASWEVANHRLLRRALADQSPTRRARWRADANGGSSFPPTGSSPPCFQPAVPPTRRRPHAPGIAESQHPVARRLATKPS